MIPKMRFVLTALSLAWAGDLLLWKSALGVNFTVWVALALLAGFLLARSEQVKPARLTWLLAAVALGLAAITFIRSQSFTIFVSLMLSLACLMLMAATFTHANWISYRLVDYLKSILHLVAAILLRPFSIFGKSQSSHPSSSAEIKPKSVRRRFLPILRGILLALPVLLVFTTLLASADPIFGDQVKGWLSWFDLAHLGEYIFRLVYILILAFVFTGVYLHAIHPANPEARPDPQTDGIIRLLGWVETATMLVLVNILFIIFVAIQFWYLFGGQANISATHYTYAEYARRGFNELVAVAILSLGLYISLATITRMDQSPQKRWFSALSALLILQVLVILASAFQRLLLYENAYGWTQLRTYTHFFIIWLALLLLATIVLELLAQRHRFALAGLIFAVGFGVTLGILNVDGFIAQRNIERASTGSELDARYLSVLSSDAVPTLFNEYLRPDQSKTVRDVLGAELACRTAVLQDESQHDWRGANLSVLNAGSLLTNNQALWSAYPVTRSGRKISVKVNGVDKTCFSGDRFLD